MQGMQNTIFSGLRVTGIADAPFRAERHTDPRTGWLMARR
jgi:hypothetical protein